MEQIKVTVGNYQKLASRTMATLGSQAVDGAHMAMGITTELCEMDLGIANEDLNNIREEHGDCLWYVANECNIYNMHFEDIYYKAIEWIEGLGEQFELHELVDLHKRELAYGKAMDVEKLEEQLVRLVADLFDAAYSNNFDFKHSLQLNIDKLAARYGDKFSQDRALNRDLEKEEEILKG